MKHFHCPVNGWDCPYFKSRVEINDTIEYCICTLKDPYHDCDDFAYEWGGINPADYIDEN